MEHIVEIHATGQPILVGTHDVAESEELHERLIRRGVPAVVLNAKNDEEEAAVIAEAGKLGTVTVSTQMAGRGTDIRLGGSEETDHDKVAELGGLHVIGTGRHRTERLDNQLRGRAGRQGDPGSSVFFASWEDDVIVAHLDEGKLPTEADETGRITSPKAGTLLDHAQRIAEGRLLDVHANTWRYNQLIAQQRAIIVERRNTLLSTPAARNELKELSPDRYEELAEKSDEDQLETICRQIMLFHLDRGWADHLAYLADIREKLVQAGALVGESDHRVSKSLYAKDPSGIEFEVMWRVPAQDWAAELAGGEMILPLDLDAAISRWGQDQATGAAAGSPT
jgi:preprotein translocase subunit SecA